MLPIQFEIGLGVVDEFVKAIDAGRTFVFAFGVVIGFSEVVLDEGEDACVARFCLSFPALPSCERRLRVC